MGEDKEVVAVGEGLAVLEEEEEGLEALGEDQEVVVVVKDLTAVAECLTEVVKSLVTVVGGQEVTKISATLVIAVTVMTTVEMEALAQERVALAS